MRTIGIAACSAATLLVATVAARAQPIDDVGPWVAKFQAAVAAGRYDEMTAQVQAVASPQLSLAKLKDLFDDLAGRMGKQRVDHTEVFDERDLGGLFKRAAVAAHYESGYLFYAVTFVRDSVGWQLFQIDWSPDVNKILALRWPG